MTVNRQLKLHVRDDPTCNTTARPTAAHNVEHFKKNPFISTYAKHVSVIGYVTAAVNDFFSF